MIAFFLLAPMVFISTLMSMFAGIMAMVAASLTVVIGMVLGALMVCSSCLLGIMIVIFS